MTGTDQTACPGQGTAASLLKTPPLKGLTPDRLESVLETVDRYEPALKRLSEI